MSQDIPRAPRYREYRSAEELMTNLGIPAPPQAIFIPDSGIVRRFRPGNDAFPHITMTWMPPAYRDEYAESVPAPYSINFTEEGEPINGCAGGKARCLAGFYLSEAFPHALVVPMSKFEIPKNDPFKACVNAPTEHYKVNGRYLRRLGVSEDKMAFATESTSIFEGMIEMLRMCEQRGITDAVFITNEYNKPRAQALLNALLDRKNGVQKKLKYLIAISREEFRRILGVIPDADSNQLRILVDENTHDKLTGNVNIKILTAEEVLTQFSSLYGKVIEKAKQRQQYKNRERAELNGAVQIEEGTYYKNAWINARRRARRLG